MTFEIELGGRRRAVDVRQEGAAWMVTVDGRTFTATVAEVGGRWSLLLGSAEGRAGADPSELRVESGFSRTSSDVRTHRSYEVSFDARTDGVSVVRVNGEPIPLAVIDPRQRRRRAPAADAAAEANGPAPIVAPMPGRIVKVLVGPGEAVAARQGVVVVEAMKMENELRAPAAGTVREVHVAAGTAVEKGARLVTLELTGL